MVAQRGNSKGPAPQPPAPELSSPQPLAPLSSGSQPQLLAVNNSDVTTNLDGKRKVKKVVRRTVSVKKSVAPPTQSFDGPPEDGFDYIKICGKWVKMKTSKSDGPVDVNSNRMSATRREKETDAEESRIPPSRGEWGTDVSVGKKCQHVTGALQVPFLCGLEIPRSVLLL